MIKMALHYIIASSYLWSQNVLCCVHTIHSHCNIFEFSIVICCLNFIGYTLFHSKKKKSAVCCRSKFTTTSQQLSHKFAQNENNWKFVARFLAKYSSTSWHKIWNKAQLFNSSHFNMMSMLHACTRRTAQSWVFSVDQRTVHGDA